MLFRSERVLGRQLPGVDVPWRDTGGDSLMALEVLSAVERRIGCRLSSEILQANASPAWMARQVQRGLHLRSSGTSAHSRLTGKLWVITSLHAATVHDRRIVEGLAGDVDGDIVAITSLDDELESVRSLEELAGDCARTIVEQTEKGVPVHLLGLSFGGRIALHAAHLLRQRGVQVGLVGIGDIPCAAKDVRFLAMNRVQRHGDEPPTSALRRPWITAARLAKASVRELVAWATSRRWTWLIRCLVRPGRQALGDRFASAMRFAIRQGQVMGWKAPRLEGEVTLFVSRETGEELSYLQPTLGWEGHADLVARVDVAGSHTSYHRDENTAGFVAAVRGRLLHHANQSRKVTLPC